MFFAPATKALVSLFFNHTSPVHRGPRPTASNTLCSPPQTRGTRDRSRPPPGRALVRLEGLQATFGRESTTHLPAFRFSAKAGLRPSTVCTSCGVKRVPASPLPPWARMNNTCARRDITAPRNGSDT